MAPSRLQVQPHRFRLESASSNRAAVERRLLVLTIITAQAHVRSLGAKDAHDRI